MSIPESVHILIVDDEPAVRMSLRGYLCDRGFNVHLSESAEDALKLLETQTIDVAIVDIRLEGMDGNTFILKAHEERPLLKFLIYTGSSQYVLVPALVEIGISNADVFRKPLKDMSVIVDAVNRHTK